MCDSYFSEAEAEEWSFLDFYKHRSCQIDFTKSIKREALILKSLEYLFKTGSEKAKSLLDVFKNHRGNCADVDAFWNVIEAILAEQALEMTKANFHEILHGTLDPFLTIQSIFMGATTYTDELFKTAVENLVRILCVLLFCFSQLHTTINEATITTHINSKAHKDSRRSYVAANRNDRQQSLHATMVVADGKKQIIKSLADSIRKHHLSGIFEQHYEQLREIFCGKPVSIIIDKTTDKKARSVINTLFSYRGQTKLILYPNLYEKSVREILQPVMSQIRHNTCCAHIIQLIRYMDYLQRHGIKDIATKSDNRFYSEEHELESNETIENIMSIFNDRNANGLTEIYLAFIHYHSRQFILDTDFFQKETEPIFPLIEARIQQLEIYLTYGTTATDFGNEINNVLSKYNTELSTFIPIFQSAFNAAYNKFSIHFSNHPS
ncbi:654_t:CDS:2 [Diversispora eburnea]|uniref:654_t:CDS:1 n=1 Tax=Diversispora eburnea TaxID=1213867 RepID=A0A9N8VZ28_9GLOM|nr:654_t:CDS:2 [Diversispora eburnea]